MLGCCRVAYPCKINLQAKSGYVVLTYGISIFFTFIHARVANQTKAQGIVLYKMRGGFLLLVNKMLFKAHMILKTI